MLSECSSRSTAERLSSRLYGNASVMRNASFGKKITFLVSDAYPRSTHHLLSTAAAVRLRQVDRHVRTGKSREVTTRFSLLVLGLYQTFANFFSKVAVGSRKPEIFTKVAGGTRASGYDSVRASKNFVSRLSEKVQFLGKSRAAARQEAGPIRQNQDFVQNNSEN